MFTIFKKLFGSPQKKRNKPSLVVKPGAKAMPVVQGIDFRELCGIDPNSMSREEIKRHLAMLYKRHNNAASSLNPELRTEANRMLDAIADCRDQYVDQESP